MATQSQVEVKMAPCCCGIFLDNVNLVPMDSLAVGEPLNFEADETGCKRKFDFQYKETSYDNDEIST